MPITYITFFAGGRQYRARAGETITVNKMAGAVGATVSPGPVCLAEMADGAVVTGEAAAKLQVSATIAGHLRGDKLRVFKMRRRKKSRRTAGHRQELTRLVIGEMPAAPAA